ncbi:MAG: ISL3 family transposase, partial [Brachybacterium faecium]
MLNHSCVCPDALDRCDRTQAPSGLVLEVESCVPVQGCPGCGVIATGHGRVVVEVIDAPWAGRPVRVRWRKRRWICHEDV